MIGSVMIDFGPFCIITFESFENIEKYLKKV